MKSHIGPNGPGKCTASVQDCPFGGADNHFATLAAARIEYEDRLTKAYEEVAVSKSKKARLTPKENELRARNAELAKQIVELRAQAGGITYEDANPVRAKKRLEESIAFAESRGNTHLVEKLSHATVLPSGAFKLEDGSRANVDKYLKAKQTVDDVDAGREKLIENINNLLKTESTDTAKFSLKTDAGSFSLTLKPSFNQEEFDKLAPGLQEKIKSPKSGLSIEAARANLTPEVLATVTNDSQVVDFVVGKPVETDAASVTPKMELTGDTTDAKINSGVKNIADFYGDVRAKTGRIKTLKDEISDNNTAIKSAASKNSGAVFVPARSQSNGLVVTRRQTLSPAEVKAKLTPEQIASITVEKQEPDAQLAQTILPPATFGKIFGTINASLRFTEAS